MAHVVPIDHVPRRDHARLRLDIAARLLCFEGMESVTLIDLSESGARLALGGNEKVSGGMLSWLGFETFGDAVWQVADQLALRFDEPICREWIIATRQWDMTQLRPEVQARDAAREWAVGHRAFGGER